MGAVGALVILTFVAGFLGLAGAAAIGAGIVYGIRHAGYALKGEPYRPLLGAGSQAEYEHQDVNAGADFASVRTILKRYQHTDGVGPYARDGLNSLDSAERKSTNFYAVLDNKFAPGSITWEKFAGAASAAREAVLRNCAELTNDIQVFDHADYRQLTVKQRRSTFRSDVRMSAVEQEKLALMQEQLNEMGTRIAANDNILLELDRLSVELDRINDAGVSSESERLVNEIRTLTSETKYYKEKLDEMDQR